MLIGLSGIRFRSCAGSGRCPGRRNPTCAHSSDTRESPVVRSIASTCHSIVRDRARRGGVMVREARVERAFRGSKPRVLPLDDSRVAVGPEGVEPSSHRLRGGCCSSSATNPFHARERRDPVGREGVEPSSPRLKVGYSIQLSQRPRVRSDSAFAHLHHSTSQLGGGAWSRTTYPNGDGFTDRCVSRDTLHPRE